jgi:hypothetical protein
MAEGSNKGGGLPPGTILFLLAFLGVRATHAVDGASDALADDDKREERQRNQ